MSRKISRIFLSTSQLQATPETTDAGPSENDQADWNETDRTVPSPSTEYTDQFGGLPLPSYYHSAEIDPVAFASLGYGPGINGVDYTGPPSESFDEPDESPSQAFPESESLADGSFTS